MYWLILLFIVCSNESNSNIHSSARGFIVNV
jgi:hypothetical protein